MYCKYCGADVSDDAKFCDVCGKYIEVKADTIPVYTPVEINSAPQEAAVIREPLADGFFFKGVGFFKKLALYAIGVLLIFIVAAFVFVYNYPEYAADTASYISRFFN